MQNLGVFGETVADERDRAAVAGRCDPAAAAARRVGDMALGATRLRGSMAVAGRRADDGRSKAGESVVDLFVDAAEPAGRRAVEPTIRSEFADTALWVAASTPNADGLAEVELDMPENLTTWKISVWGWATAPGSAKRRAKSSPARTSSSACKRRGSSSRRTKSCSAPTSTTTSPTPSK